jgi:hypothetical protein
MNRGGLNLADRSGTGVLAQGSLIRFRMQRIGREWMVRCGVSVTEAA